MVFVSGKDRCLVTSSFAAGGRGPLDEWTAEGIDQLLSCHPTAEADVLSRAASTVFR